MAIRLTSLCSASKLTGNHGSVKGSSRNSTVSRVVMCASDNHISVDLQISIRSSNDNQIVKNKVFEDKAAGIVCYKDENGEIICEGYDEGPRFPQQISRITCNSSDSRDVEIIDMLQRCWLHVAEGEELNIADKGFKGCRAEGF